MGEILGPILIIVISAVVSAMSKKQVNKSNAAKTAMDRSAQQRQLNAQWEAYLASSKAKPVTPKPAAPKPEDRVLPSREGSDKPMAPTVHAHVLNPDCDEHDRAGSLGVTTTEGKDPCHDEQLSNMRTADEPVAVQPGLTLKWDSESLVNAFVMQEILTRPSQRRAAR